jgi:chromosome segregation ATPase
MIDYIKGTVKIYQRNIKRKLKDGTTKTYKTLQHQVVIKDNDLFTDGQVIALVSLEELQNLLKDYTSNKKDLETLNNSMNIYRKSTENEEKLSHELDRLRNKHDHLQERLRKALEEINQQGKVISDLSNRSVWDFIRGKLPESYQLLSEGKP